MLLSRLMKQLICRKSSQQAIVCCWISGVARLSLIVVFTLSFPKFNPVGAAQQSGTPFYKNVKIENLSIRMAVFIYGNGNKFCVMRVSRVIIKGCLIAHTHTL